MNFAFALVFAIEVLVRVYAERYSFFLGAEKWWNLFDVFLSLAAAADLVLNVFQISFVRSLRVFRAVRAAKILRSIRYVKELRLMVFAIGNSLLSLTWGLILLVFLIFLFAILMMQGVEQHIRSSPGEPVSEELLSTFGNVQRSVLTLLMAISGGQDWVDFLVPLESVNTFYAGLFVVYVLVMGIGVFAILTGIFVEAAATNHQNDSNWAIQQEIEKRKATINKLRRFLHRADVDLDGKITKAEFEHYLSQEDMRAHLSLLDLDPTEAQDIFRLVDIEGRNEVAIEELVDRFMRLRGSATSVDIANLLFSSQRTDRRLKSFMFFVEERFSAIGKKMDVAEPAESETDFWRCLTPAHATGNSFAL